MERIYLPRLLSPEEATQKVGEKVPTMLPTVKVGTILHDADTKEPIVGVFRLPDPANLRRALRLVDQYGTVKRAKTYTSRSRTFGWAPRRPLLLREACSRAAMVRDYPTTDRTLETYADTLAPLLDQIDPQIRARDTKTLEPVLSDWRLGSTKHWTSGVVNDTAALPYHRDGFNFHTWSAMPVLRRGTRGGHLSLPEYGVVLACEDSSVTCFEGWKYVHGVTPISKVQPDGYRISVVYYALSGMKNCRSHAEEQGHAKRKRTERETTIAQRLKDKL